MFKLFRNYSIISLVAFLIVSVLLGQLYRNGAENDLRLFAEKENITIASSTADMFWYEFEKELTKIEGSWDIRTHKNAKLDLLYKNLIGKFENTDIVKLTIYTIDGQVLFSTELDEIGSFYIEESGSDPFFIAKKGEVASEETIDTNAKTFAWRELSSAKVFSSFVPIRKSSDVIEATSDDGHDDHEHTEQSEPQLNDHNHNEHDHVELMTQEEVGAIFEVHTDTTHLVDSIVETQKRVTFSSLGVLGVLFFTLLWFVGRAEKAIRKNITEQKQAQVDELERIVVEKTADLVETNAKLEQTAIMKDAFFASMSHELRTPLNMIYSRTQALQMKIYGEVNEKQAEVLKGIDLGSTHLISLINDILDVSKLSAGRLELSKETAGIQHLIDISLALTTPLASERNIVIQKNVSPNVSNILIDQRRVVQILVNLLSNAVKFTSHGGRVGIRVIPKVGQRLIYFSIWDTGVGISKEDQDKLFSEFTQLDNRFSREHNGTGLGLYLVKELTELHGGTVRINSKAGQGSEFIVALPWDPKLDSSYQMFHEQNKLINA